MTRPTGGETEVDGWGVVFWIMGEILHWVPTLLTGGAGGLADGQLGGDVVCIARGDDGD